MSFGKIADIQTISPPGSNVELYYWYTEIPAVIEGTICDIECTGLDPDTESLTAIGFVRWNKLSVFVLKSGEDSDFRAWAIKKLRYNPRPYVAYNRRFESRWLETRFDRDVQPKKYQAKDRVGGNEHHGYTNPAIKIDHLGDLIHNGDVGSAGPMTIMKHLIQDMYTELALYVTLAYEVRWGNPIMPEFEEGA